MQRQLSKVTLSGGTGMTVKEFNIGDNVLIIYRQHKDDMKYVDRAIKDFINTGRTPISGTIISATMSDDLSYHGSPYYEYYYQVQGDDGKIYKTGPFATYGPMVVLMSKKSFLSRLKSRYTENDKKIAELTSENNKIRTLLSKVQMIGLC